MTARFLQRSRIIAVSLALLAVLPFFALSAQPAQAAANMFVSVPVGVKVGDTVSITVSVNTGGQSANAFEGTVSYPTNLFNGVRGTYSGSICTLPILQPDPSGGSADFSCGAPGGYTGTGLVTTIVLTAKASGTGTIGLSGCTVLANDGHGTAITGGCTGSGITVTGSATPTPVATQTTTEATPPPTANPTVAASGGSKTPTPTATPKATPTPKTSSSPTPTPTPDVNKPVKAAETPQEGESPAEPTAPPVQTLAPSTSTPDQATQTDDSSSSNDQPAERRTVSQAFRDIFGSLGQFKSIQKDVGGLIALLVASIPFLLITLAVLYFIYRLYLLERRRKHMMDRLFEMELSELAALEGKLDLLGEKGVKGREQYREEFQKAKENILRQLRPDYAKPPIGAAAPAADPAPEGKR